MADITEHHAALDPVEDQPNVTAGTGRPEVLVFDVVETVTLQAWIGRIYLQFEGCELGRFLLITAESVKTRLK
jgi:hypothetical protein